MSKGLINDDVHVFLTDRDMAKLESGQEVRYEETTSGYAIIIKVNR